MKQTYYNTKDNEKTNKLFLDAITSVDLMFLIDGSGSVKFKHPINFRRIQQWIKRVTSAFDLTSSLLLIKNR